MKTVLLNMYLLIGEIVHLTQTRTSYESLYFFQRKKYISAKIVSTTYDLSVYNYVLFTSASIEGES